MEIVFALTEWNYDSYTDYRKLIQLSGFRTCLVKDVDFERPAVYIVSPANAELPAMVKAQKERGVEKKCKLIVWWLERPDAAKTLPSNRVKHALLEEVDEFFSLVDEVWVSDRHLASLDSRLKYVLLGSHPKLREKISKDKKYDYCHMSYVYGRRGEILGALTKDLKEGPNGWGVERDRTLNASRAIVNVHQTPMPIGEPLRFSLSAAYELPLISEHLADPWPMKEGTHFISFRADEIQGKVSDALKRPDLSRLGKNLHALLCLRNTFGEVVRKKAQT